MVPLFHLLSKRKTFHRPCLNFYEKKNIQIKRETLTNFRRVYLREFVKGKSYLYIKQ